MITGKAFAEMALSFAGTEQVPHFERIGFKVMGKRLFATYLEKENTANVFLTQAEQAATTLPLDTVPRHIALEALLSAYNEVVDGKGKRKSSR